MSDFTFEVLKIVIMLVGVVLTYKVVPWIQGNVDVKNLALMQTLIQAFVAAAEQLFPKAGSGAIKKAYVLEKLKDKGVTITDQELDALIEAAVYELNKVKNLLVKDLDLQPVVGEVEFSE
jgi:LL-H family phage holin